MAQYGLQVKDPNTGLVILAVTDRITRMLGSISTGTVSGSLTIPTVANSSAWYAIVPTITSSPGGANYNCTVSLSGNVITWTFAAANGRTPIPLTIVYGLY